MENASFPKEYKIPGILLAIGLGIFVMLGFASKGIAGVVATMFALPIFIGITQGAGLVAGIVAAKLFGADFGYLSSALLKILAIVIFSFALTFFIPYIGWAFRMGIWMALLIWLFDFHPREAMLFTVVAFVINFMALFFLGAAIALHV